jgi:hypothetical protein
MPRGTVKDPTGHQSSPYEFGFIKRNKLKWPKLNRFKVIPYLNRDKPVNRAKPQDSTPIHSHPGPSTIYASVEAFVYVKNSKGKTMELGNIGVAVLDSQKEILDFLGLEAPTE